MPTLPACDQPPEPILVRLPNWIGDVVMTLPALHHLHEHGHALTLLGRPWAAPLLHGTPWPVRPIGRTRAERITAMREARRATGASTALLLTNSFSSAIEARWACLRPTGFRHDGRGLLLSRGVDRRAADRAFDALVMEADDAMTLVNLETFRYDALAAAMTGVPVDPRHLPVLRVHADSRARVGDRLQALGIDPLRAVVLVPFATGQLKASKAGRVPDRGNEPGPGRVAERHGKQWPGFNELCRRLARDEGFTVLIAPGPDETERARTSFPDAALLEGLAMDDYAALLASCALVVANDTGPGHVAAAVGARLISVLGPTDPVVHGVRGHQVTLVGGSRRQRATSVPEAIGSAASGPAAAGPANTPWQWPDVDTVHAAVRQSLGASRHSATA